MIKPDIILCDIISTDMEIDPTRVVVYNQNFKPPKDDDIYIVVSEGISRIIGNTNRFEPADSEAEPPTVDREVKSVSKATEYNIEITSKNTDAKYRKEEILMAITSDYSQQKQEENQIKVSRTSQISDLSFIEGGSSLHRYRITVIINSVNIKEKAITPIDKFQTPQGEIE